jgi:hypothetical protein
MTYAVGTHIDLRYLNDKGQGGATKSAISQAGQTLYLVGTRFIFWATPNGLKMAVKIPVVYA